MARADSRSTPAPVTSQEIIDTVLTDAAPDFFSRAMAWWSALGLVLVLSLVVALPGIDTIPLESHEIFVAQSVREMSARGDWLLPYFNGQPRLNKPPMNYWLTGLIAHIDGALPDVAPRHARLVSVLGGMGLLGLTMLLGAMLFDRLTAVIAGLLLVSGAGFFTFTHDARPDMLYAFFTTAMLVAGIKLLRDAQSASETSPRWTLSIVMWVCFALATLTKGPHLPALALLGLFAHAALTARGVRAPWRALHVPLGLAIVALPAGAWWGWLRVTLDGSTLAGSQLAGSLLTPQWSQIGNPYYLYRPLELLLPWLPVVLISLAGLLLKPSRRDTGWLWWPLLTACLALSCGRQFRFFYLLPLLAPLVLVVARPLAVVLRSELGHWPRQLLVLGLLLQAVLAAACAGWVLVLCGRIAYLTPPIMSLLAGGGLAYAVFRMLLRRQGDERGGKSFAALAATAVFIAFIWPGGAMTGVLWDKERFDAQRLAEEAAREVHAGRTLATLGVSPTVYIYAANARVAALNSASEVTALMAQSTSGLSLIVRSDRLSELAAPLRVNELARARNGSRDEILVRVTSTP